MSFCWATTCGYQQSISDESELVRYALNPNSERGQHKARVFQSALGFNLSNWKLLKQAILDALPSHQAEFISETVFGRKYEVTIEITGPNSQLANITTIWQYDYEPDRDAYSDTPRLVTLYLQ